MDSWLKIIDPNHLSAEILGSVGTEKIVTIKDIRLDECYDNDSKKKVEKWCIFFDELVPMILNKTNSKTLKKLFSPNDDDPSKCIGHKIILKVEEVKAFGKMTTGIRIKEYSEVKCDECGQAILPYNGKTVSQIIDISKRNFNKCLCGKCMVKKGKEKNAN